MADAAVTSVDSNLEELGINEVPCDMRSLRDQLLGMQASVSDGLLRGRPPKLPQTGAFDPTCDFFDRQVLAMKGGADAVMVEGFGEYDPTDIGNGNLDICELALEQEASGFIKVIPCSSGGDEEVDGPKVLTMQGVADAVMADVFRGDDTTVIGNDNHYICELSLEYTTYGVKNRIPSPCGGDEEVDGPEVLTMKGNVTVVMVEAYPEYDPTDMGNNNYDICELASEDEASGIRKEIPCPCYSDEEVDGPKLSLGNKQIENGACIFCKQPPRFCCKFNPHTISFEVKMVEGFEESVCVPCKFSKRLKFFTNKWLIVICPSNLRFDFHLLWSPDVVLICGAYWRSFVRAYDIKLNDIVTFKCVSWGSLFNINVLNMNREEKGMFMMPVLFEVPKDSERTFQRTVFSNFSSLTEAEVGAIIRDINTKVLLAGINENGEVPNCRFLVHTMTHHDIIYERLLFHPRVTRGLTSPFFHDALFWNINLDKPMRGEYLLWRGESFLYSGWSEFCKRLEIVQGSTILVTIEERQYFIWIEVSIISQGHYILLDF